MVPNYSCGGWRVLDIGRCVKLGRLLAVSYDQIVESRPLHLMTPEVEVARGGGHLRGASHASPHISGR
jgi:hypothetical protein